MKINLFSLFVVTIWLASCSKHADNSEAITNINDNRASISADGIIATKAGYYDSLFTRYGNGWTGGDGAVSYRLPDGRDLWLFGDTYLGNVTQIRTRKVQGFINNTMALTSAVPNEFITLYNGTLAAPSPLFVPKEKNTWYWASNCFSNKTNDSLFVFLIKVASTGEGGAFGFKVLGVDIAIMSLPDLKLDRIITFVRGNKINWSSAFMEDDGYIYIYGAESSGFTKWMHVARTTKENLLGDVRYYNNTAGWVKDSSNSSRIRPGVSENYSVFKSNSKYYLITQTILLGQQIYIYDAPSPIGPFTNKRLVYTTPLVTPDCFTYNATAHLQFLNEGKLLVGYSSNTNNSREQFTKVDTYRPYFVWVENWQ